MSEGGAGHAYPHSEQPPLDRSNKHVVEDGIGHQVQAFLNRVHEVNFVSRV